MKSDAFTDIVCRGFCRFYREGKESQACGTYDFLARNLTAAELASMAPGIRLKPAFSKDEEIMSLACMQCDFLIDGCDFREGLDAPPCGGYTILASLL